MKWGVISATVAFLIAGAGAAFAQDQKPDRAPSGPVSKLPILKGPSVAEQRAPSSLIEKDFAGKIRRLEVTPEEAAVERLTLSTEAREKVATVLHARWAIIDKAVKENVESLLRFDAARRTGDRREMVALLRKFAQELKPLRDRGTLREEIRGVLPEDQRADFDWMCDEYTEALIAEAQQEAQSKGEPSGDTQARIREGLLVIGQELKRSYDRLVTGGQRELEEAIKLLDLTPEQEGEVRRLVSQFAADTKLNPTPEQRRKLLVDVYAVLDASQRARIRDLARDPMTGK